MKYNTMFDIAFTVDHDHADPDDIPLSELLDAARQRLNDIEKDAARWGSVAVSTARNEAFGQLDTYENQKE